MIPFCWPPLTYHTLHLSLCTFLHLICHLPPSYACHFSHYSHLTCPPSLVWLTDWSDFFQNRGGHIVPTTRTPPPDTSDLRTVVDIQLLTPTPFTCYWQGFSMICISLTVVWTNHKTEVTKFCSLIGPCDCHTAYGFVYFCSIVEICCIVSNITGWGRRVK